ncbi:MAG TPA: SpoIIE family protein phosphatase [Planctomycetota bacterium]|nr:SpoIIE family protein phosphatase [Planctomycetota bacterium]
MTEKSGSTRHTRVHARDRDFTLYVRKRGLFTLLAPVGRYSDALLGGLAEFLQKPDFLAVDLSKLDAVALPLMRAFSEYASTLDPKTGSMVLVRPPDKIRALLKLVDRESRITLAVSDRDLEGSAVQVQDRVRKAHERVHLVRTMLETNPCWQLADGEGRWLCPFCVTLRPGIRFVARGSVTQRVVDGVATHLNEECSTYTDGKTDGWPFEVLERVLISGQPPPERLRVGKGPATPSTRKAPRVDLTEGLDARRRHLLPPEAPRLEGCEISVYYGPAEDMSGDFYDFIRLPDRRIAIVVGDISAGGANPGVLMGIARKVLRIRLAETKGDVQRALGLANDDFCDDLDRECYVTAAVALIDGPRREMKIARAGHAAPFLVRGTTSPVVERLALPGPLLGLVPTATFEEEIEVQSFALNPGDLLLLHTDGLEELRDRSGDMFGADRVASILQANAGSPAEFVLGAAVLEAEQFCSGADRDQDMTAVCVRFR